MSTVSANKLGTKILCFIMAVALVVGFMPNTAYAAQENAAFAESAPQANSGYLSGHDAKSMLPSIGEPAALEGQLPAAQDAPLQTLAASSDTVLITGKHNFDYMTEVARLVNQERAKQGLGELALSYELTLSAMQRAAECSVYYSHTRPNGKECFSIFPPYGYMFAENIAAGYSSPASVMNGWMNSPGHRGNILTAEFTAIGVGCFTQGGAIYWVQCFETAADPASLNGGSAEFQHNVDINYTQCGNDQGFNMNMSKSSYSKMTPGQTFKLSYDVANDDFGYSYVSLDPESATWTSSDPGVCKVDEEGLVTAVSRGTATITATLPSGKSVSNTFTVDDPTMKDSTIKAKVASTVAYNGKAQKPSVTVTANGKTLKNGKDYTLTYKNNTKIGTASVTIKGKGKYSGTKTVKFDIVPGKVKNLSLKAGKKKITVKWKNLPASQASGYTVRVATSRSMKGAEVYSLYGGSKKAGNVNGLRSGQKYYLQIAAFKDVGGKTYVGDWSAAKSVKVK